MFLKVKKLEFSWWDTIERAHLQVSEWTETLGRLCQRSEVLGAEECGRRRKEDDKKRRQIQEQLSLCLSGSEHFLPVSDFFETANLFDKFTRKKFSTF